eukprot:Awhi_evm1s9213
MLLFNRQYSLVNNAGTNKRKPTTDYAEEEYDNIININQKSVFMFTKQCHPFLKNAAGMSYYIMTDNDNDQTI